MKRFKDAVLSEYKLNKSQKYHLITDTSPLSVWLFSFCKCRLKFEGMWYEFQSVNSPSLFVFVSFLFSFRLWLAMCYLILMLLKLIYCTILKNKFWRKVCWFWSNYLRHYLSRSTRMRSVMLRLYIYLYILVF